MKKLHVIISFDGNFFLTRTADLISKSVKVIVIQNYVPGIFTGWIIRLYDKVFSKQSYQNKCARKVSSKDVESHNISINDFIKRSMQLMKLPVDIVDSISAVIFGFFSKKWIKSADIFHVRSGYGQGGAIKRAHKYNMSVIVDHSIAHNNEITSILGPEYKKHNKPIPIGTGSRFWDIVERDCKSADVLLVNSDYVKQTFVDNGYNPDKICVIYLGVREDWLGKKTDYSLSNGVINLLFVGGFGIRKGAEYVLRAIPLLEKKNINFKITVIGGNKELNEEIYKYDIKKRLDFIGYLPYEKLMDYYVSADVFLFPSLCEGATRAGMEAMGVGLPVIMTNNCGCPIVNEENGLIVPIKDEVAISEAIERLYKSKELREKLGKSSSRLIRMDYTWSQYKINLLNLYEQCRNQSK